MDLCNITSFFARTFSGLLWYPKIKFWITRTITNINTSLIIRLINSALPYSYNNLARLLLNSFIWRWKIERQNMQWRCWKMKVISRKLFSENYSNYLLTKYLKRSHWIDIVINHKKFYLIFSKYMECNISSHRSLIIFFTNHFFDNHCAHSFHEWKTGLRYQVSIMHRDM